MNRLTHLSLFSGIGGLDLAAEWAGFITVGQREWADYPTKVLEKHWPDVPRWRDIRTLTGESFYERTGLHTVDVISGGFPCQPFSVAGKQRGKEDDRYLWPEMVRVIKELRPAWIIGENVAGIVRMALPDILSELEACGYRTRAFLIPACAVGARHRRYRVAIVAYSGHNVLSGREHKGESSQRPSCNEPEPCSCGGPGRTPNMENADCIRCSHPENVCEQPGRTELERTSKALANTESQHEGRLPVRAEKKVTGSVSSGQNVADTQGERERGLPVQQGRPQKEDTDTKRTGKTLADADNGSRFMRGNGELSAIKETGEKWDNNGCGKAEHEPGQRRTAQPGLGGMADGISDWVDGAIDYLEENAGDFADDDDYLEWYWNDFIINHYWDTEPDIPRVAAGIPDRIGRLKALGNAVVPQQFYPFFRAIADVRKEITHENRFNRCGWS